MWSIRSLFITNPWPSTDFAGKLSFFNHLIIIQNLSPYIIIGLITQPWKHASLLENGEQIDSPAVWGRGVERHKPRLLFQDTAEESGVSACLCRLWFLPAHHSLPSGHAFGARLRHRGNPQSLHRDEHPQPQRGHLLVSKDLWSRIQVSWGEGDWFKCLLLSIFETNRQWSFFAFLFRGGIRKRMRDVEEGERQTKKE